MKNGIIKTIGLFLAMAMIFSTSVFAADTDENVYIFEYENRTIEIDATELTYEQAKQIADAMVYGETTASTYASSILCIFGHKLAETYAKETTHKAYASNPRCVVKTYVIEYCTRSSCTYCDATETSSVRVSCCAE